MGSAFAGIGRAVKPGGLVPTNGEYAGGFDMLEGLICD